MTVSSQDSSVEYNANGVTADFEIPFPFFSNADIQVSTRDANGDTAILSTGFTITGERTGTGNCNFDPVLDDVAIVIERVPQFLQQSDYVTNDRFPAETNEADHDRDVMLSQYLYRLLQGCVRFPKGDASFGSLSELPTVSTRKSTNLGFDSQGRLSLSAYLASSTLSQSTIGGFLTPQTETENAKGVIPLRTWYNEGDIRRHAMLDGTDETARVQNWAKCGGTLTWPVAQTAIISGEITLSSNTRIVAARGAMIQQNGADLAIFRATSQSNIHISGLHFKQTNWGGSAYVAHVLFDSCTYCHAIDNEFEGVQWAGVYLRAARHCTVRGNHFHDSFPQQSINFTVAPVSGATSRTLTAAWTLPTGAYTAAFVETAGGAIEGKQVTLTHGATTATWSGGLSANCNAAVTVQAATDSADINLHSDPGATCAFNDVDANFCYSNTLSTGISVQDPYNGVLPYRNTVRNNKITAHLAYGILSYMPDAGDSYNQFIGNFIEGITGSFALNQSSGAGIYLAGQGVGGTVVADNIVRDCCKNTANASLAPAGIGITGPQTGGVPVTVTGNVISDMSQYHGILLTGVTGGASVANNTIRMPASNTTGHAVVVNNSNAIGLNGNILVQLNTTSSQRGYLIQALGASCSDISITGGSVKGGHFTQIETAVTGGARVTGLTIAGVTLDGSDSNCIGIQLSAVDDAAVTGNVIHMTGGLCVNHAGCTGVIYSGNRFKGATDVIALAGTNTGTRVDRSNLGLAGASVNNAGTGAIVEIYATAVPGAGVWAVGDSVQLSAPTASNPVMWFCITAGTGGGTAVFKTLTLSP
ncbi:MAG: hypothetical protein V4457_06165 [Pseudomonadota bacterium]